MRYEDYKAEVILRERLPEYGRSVDMCVTAESEAAAVEAAKHDFTVFTGLPSSLIESVEVAPILSRQEAAEMGAFLDGYTEAHRKYCATARISNGAF